MKYTRIYADTNGESHFEDVEISMKPGPANAGTISEMIAAKGVMFRQSGEYFINWHNAPRRQFVVNLTGTVEIVASDGEKRRLGPGSILLAEDLTLGEATPEDDERIEIHMTPLSEVLSMIAEGKIEDGKTLIGVLFYASQRRSQ